MKTLLLFVLAADAVSAQSQSGRATLEVRLAVPCSAARAGRPLKDPEGAGSICLDRAPFLTAGDVEAAQIHHNAAGRPVILLTFQREAAMRELQVTKQNIGNRVGIVVNGKLVSAPKIPGASRLLFVDGPYTPAQAEALVDAFNRQAQK